MIDAYSLQQGRLERLASGPERAGLPPHADQVLWVDLLEPSREEVQAVESLLGLSIPTRQEMAEIEESARLYGERGALVLTAVVITGVTEGSPDRAPVTFVLTPRHLVSVRYADPVPFRAFQARIQRSPELHTTPDRILVSLIDAIVERAADVVELVQADLNEVSRQLFLHKGSAGPPARRPIRAERDLEEVINRLGYRTLVLAILRESLLTFTRLVSYVGPAAAAGWSDGAALRLQQIGDDLRSLAAYEGQLSSQIAYLHEATLGLINLEQNRILKVFSIAAVLFLPPTMVGTIYGMNFEIMPELKWSFGYPFALLLMLLSAAVPYLWIRRKGWL